jgi:hypothetical protein
MVKRILFMRGMNPIHGRPVGGSHPAAIEVQLVRHRIFNSRTFERIFDVPTGIGPIGIGMDSVVQISGGCERRNGAFDLMEAPVPHAQHRVNTGFSATAVSGFGIDAGLSISPVATIKLTAKTETHRPWRPLLTGGGRLSSFSTFSQFVSRSGARENRVHCFRPMCYTISKRVVRPRNWARRSGSAELMMSAVERASGVLLSHIRDSAGSDALSGRSVDSSNRGVERV